MDIGEKIKKLRVSKSVSVRGLAEGLRVSKSTILRIEAGRRNPNAELLKRIAGYFDVSVDYLLGLKERADEVPARILELCELAVDAGYRFRGLKDFLEWAVRSERRLEQLRGESVMPAEDLFEGLNRRGDNGVYGSVQFSEEIPKTFEGLTKKQRKELRREAIDILKALELLEGQGEAEEG